MSTPATLNGAWWRDFDRLAILACIEDVSGQPMDPNDPLPDTLVANAEALGLLPVHLRMWIFDEPRRTEFTLESLRDFARLHRLGNAEAGEAAP